MNLDTGQFCRQYYDMTSPECSICQPSSQKDRLFCYLTKVDEFINDKGVTEKHLHDLQYLYEPKKKEFSHMYFNDDGIARLKHCNKGQDKYTCGFEVEFLCTNLPECLVCWDCIQPLPVCGNDVLEGVEQCDDGNTSDGDGCESDCRYPCPPGIASIPAAVNIYCPSICGNGIIDVPEGGGFVQEECDEGPFNPATGEGNSLLPDHCRPGCTTPKCGDGVVDTFYGEECDGGIGCLPPGDAHECERPNPPPPPTCTCKDPNDPVTCPTRPVPPNDLHYSMCTDTTTPWTRLFGAGGGNGLAVDANGTITAVSWEPQPSPEPGYFVRQLDTCGNVVWEQSMLATVSLNDHGDAVDIDSCGNAYVIGRSPFGGGAFIKKLRFSDGTELWSDFFSNSFGDGFMYVLGVAVDGESNVYVGGVLDTTPEAGDVDLIFLRKYDTAGTLVWAITYDHPWGLDDSTMTYAVESHGDGVYVSGRIHHESGMAALLAKFSPTTGALTWSRPLDISEIYGGQQGHSTTEATDGNVYQVGRCAQCDDVIKYSAADGTFLDSFRVSSLETPPEPYRPSYDIAVDSGGNLLLTGIANHTISISPLVSSFNLWTAKYDPVARAFLWQDEVPGPGPGAGSNSTHLLMIDRDPTDYVYVIGDIGNPDAGVFEDTVIIRKLTPDGLTDGWPGP